MYVTIGLIVGLVSISGWATPQKRKPSDYYGEQVGAALVGTLTGASFFVIALADHEETVWGEDRPTTWCTSRVWVPLASVTLGTGAALTTDQWSQRRQMRGSVVLSWLFSTGGSLATGYYLCQAPSRSPYLVLAAQILAASLLAPLGYNMDAVIVPEEK